MVSRLNLAEFSIQLKHLLLNRPHSRPFICEGSPLECDVMVVGFNAATKMEAPFAQFWSDETGFAFEGWFAQYQHERIAKQKARVVSPTRQRLERLKQKTGLSILETNIFDYPTVGKKDLKTDQKNTEVFEFLLQSIQPKFLISHGEDAHQYLSQRFQQNVEKQEPVWVQEQGRSMIWYASPHFSLCSYQAVDDIADIIKFCLAPTQPVTMVFAPDAQMLKLIEKGEIASGFCHDSDELTMPIWLDESQKYHTLQTKPYAYTLVIYGLYPARYVGVVKSEGKLIQTVFAKYRRRVTDLKQGKPHHSGRRYRKIHDALKKAWEAGYRVECELLGNPPEGVTIDQYKADWIAQFDCKGEADVQLNQS